MDSLEAKIMFVSKMKNGATIVKCLKALFLKEDTMLNRELVSV
jgi:hypothetical protein